MNELEYVAHVGTHKRKYLHRIPSSILALCCERACFNCGEIVLLVERNLIATQGAMSLVGDKRELRIFCNICGEEIEKMASAIIEMTNGDIDKEMRKHHAEMN